MADLIIDEWLWADLSGENSLEGQREAFRFLVAVFNKCDRIVTVKGSKFSHKMFKFLKNAVHEQRDISKFYSSRFLWNLEKSVVLEENQLQELPAELTSNIKSDDWYLVRAALTSEGSLIITTDNPLRETLQEHGLHCVDRRQYVPEYILKHKRD